MKDQSGVLIGVCRPMPEVLGFVTPVFRDDTGAPVAQIVRDGRIVCFVQLDLGEEFVPLESSAKVSVGDPALYGMESEDGFAVGSPMSVANWSDADAIRAAFESSRKNESSGFLTFPHNVTRKRNLLVRLAASVAFLCLGIVLAFAVLNYLKPERVVATDVGEWQHMTLQDNTAVHVDALSRVKIEYTTDTRIVHLYKGQAVFEVEKDPKRPFIVSTNVADITAVGTRFGVSIDSSLTITVDEGTVSVARRGRADGETTLVNAGQELRLSDDTLTLPQVAQVDAKHELEWATGWLNLSGFTVDQGVEKLNRRNRVQIIVDSSTLGAEVIKDARVKVGSPESYAEAIAKERDIDVTFDMKNNQIRLSE